MRFRAVADMTAPVDRRVITATEAHRELGIPTATIRSWAHRNRIYAVSIGRDGRRWYRLADILALRYGG